MKKIILSAVALLIAYPVAANAQSTQNHFKHDGKSYAYTSRQVGDYRVISGVEANSGNPFRLRIGESRVRGTIGARPVNFRLRDVQPLIANINEAEKVTAL